MKITNFEFKAHAPNLEKLEQKLLTRSPTFQGEDHQIDTYFKVEKGRLKLREGNIENALIYYERSNTADAKLSKVLLYQHAPRPGLKAILTEIHGVKVIVDKIRRIYFIGNVKFHFDRVQSLGTFIEVEAIDKTGQVDLKDLQAQCEQYIDFFDLKPDDFIEASYSDMIRTGDFSRPDLC